MRFLDFEFILVNPYPSLFFSAEGEMRSQKAQLESEERGREGGRSPLRILLWLLPPPESCKAKLCHTKYGALESLLLLLCPFHLLATLYMALTEGCIPVEPSRDSSREICLGLLLLPPCLAPPPPPLLPAPLLLRVSCWAVMATGPPLPK